MNTEDELIKELREINETAGTWFSRREDDIKKIVNDSVGGNTFRAGPLLIPGKRPCVDVFRPWAVDMLNDKMADIKSVSTQADWDKLLNDIQINLKSKWKVEGGNDMGYGRRMKLINLVMKHFIWYTGLASLERNSILKFLHVPLDSYTISGIRILYNSTLPSGMVRANKSSSMGFVTSEKIYDYMHKIIRSASSKAGTPPIYYDILAWNMRNST